MIRKLEEADISSVANIWLETNVKTHHFISPQFWKNHFETVKKMLLQAEVYVYADNNCKIKGFIGLQNNFIEGIFVSDLAQSAGIGKQLLDFVKSMKRQLKLHVYLKNTRAIKFYQRECFYIENESIDENTGEKEYSMMWKQ